VEVGGRWGAMPTIPASIPPTSVPFPLKLQSNLAERRGGRAAPPFAVLLRGEIRLGSAASSEGTAKPGAGAPPDVPRRLPSGEERARGDDLDRDDDSQGLRRWPEVPLDAMTRALALPASISRGLTEASPAQGDAVAVAARVSLEHVLSRLVRRMAWSGDARTGAAHLEIGAGALEGAHLTIHADHGVLRVSLTLPPGADAAAWRERIARRFGVRGLQLAELDVS
jgi:hypothetical protein